LKDKIVKVKNCLLLNGKIKSKRKVKEYEKCTTW